MIRRQELHCHNCNKYVQFNLDDEISGNHVLYCPNCGHEHCRVVVDGVITDARWDRRNNNWQSVQSNVPTQQYTVSVSNATWTNTSSWNSYSNSATTAVSVYLYGSWMDRTTGS